MGANEETSTNHILNTNHAMTDHPTSDMQRFLVLQANLQRKELATHELLIEAKKLGACFALVQEPYVGNKNELKQYTGTRVIQCTRNRSKPVKAAIVVLNDDVNIIANPLLTSENIASAILKTDEWTIGVVSVYFEDSLPIEPYLEQIVEVCKGMGEKNIILGGDVNAWSTWWGSNTEDHRGEALVGVLNEMGMHILNEGNEPTFDTVRGGRVFRSNVDITACTSEILGKVQSWSVDKGLTSSDHNTIKIIITLERIQRKRPNNTTRIYNTKKADWEQFKLVMNKSLQEENINKETIQQITVTDEINDIVNKYTNIISRTCQKTLKLIKNKTKINLPWWSEELENLKKQTMTRKRRIPHAAPRRRCHVVEEYLKIKEKYEYEVKKAQINSWKEFCAKQDRESLWDGIYRVLRGTARRYEDQPLVENGIALDPGASAELLAATFFPDDTSANDNQDHQITRARALTAGIPTDHDTQDPPFTYEELKRAIASFNPKKAPGPDGFTADVCVAAISANESVFLDLINKCLELSCFPIVWKEATVVILRKPGKSDYTTPKSFRPIGLLSIMGKIMEKIMIWRIRWHILPKSNPRQYGFVPQRCTEDALYDLVNHIKDNNKKKLISIVVSLDIEGAFDSAWWPAIKCHLLEKQCPNNLRRLVDSYLRERRVAVRYAGEEAVRETTKGCVQGSIGGPTFWNLLLDPLLDILDSTGVYSQAFADDIVLVFSGSSVPALQQQAEQVLAHVYEWGVKNKLKFAPHKTLAMVVTKKLKYETPLVHMGETEIQIVSEIKILGLVIDNKLTFNNHVAHVCKKATNIYKQLARAAKISWGLCPEVIRTIYVSVIEPIIMYGASVWAEATHKITVQKHLNTVQRGFMQKICKSYRTVSLNASMILAGILPLDMRIREAAKLYEAKRGKPQEELIGDRDLEQRVSFFNLAHPAKNISIDFQCLEDTHPGTLENHHVQGIHIYTDGSKMEGKVGAAYSCWKDGKEVKSRKLKLEPFCTVFQAELLAIQEATDLILKRNETEFNIFSDSRSSLELLRSPEVSHPIAYSIRANLANIAGRGKVVRWFWVRAHVGTVGNERADALAKEAALKSKTAANYSLCPVSYLKKRIREETVREWNQRYQNGTAAAVTKLFFPDAEQAYRIITKIKLTPRLVQVFTGHGGFAAYLCRFKCKDSPACVCDPEVEETVSHILTDCPQFGKKRYDLEMKIDQLVTTENIHEILKCKESRELFMNYCLDISEKVVQRNKSD